MKLSLLHASAAACLFFCSSALAAGPPAAVSFAATPDFVAAGEPFTIAVKYEVRAGLTARLNAELKTMKHVVIQGARKQVSGKGIFEAAFTAPNQPQQLMVAVWVGTDWRKSLSPIRHTLPFDVVSPALAARRRAAMRAHRAAAAQFLKKLGPIPKDRYAIALLKDATLPSHDPKLADELAALLTKSGHEVTLIDADLLVNRQAITTDRFDMLFLPSCHTLPGEAGPVIKHYCDKGGDVAALGTPAFRTILTKVGDRWVSKDGWRKLLAEQPTKHVLFDFESEDLSRWQRHTNTPKAPFTRELVPGRKGPALSLPKGKALHVDIPNMRGWDGLASPKLEGPFPKGHSLTCFWIRGVGPTNRLSFEWRERDGSRWVAVFPVAEQWQRVVLAPSDFRFWQSVETRGHAGDQFNPGNAVQLVIGAAHTHTGRRSGKYEFLIDEIGTAPAPGELTAPEFLSPPVIENLCPSYKFYCVEGYPRVSPGGPLADSRVRELPRPERLFAHHPRPTGKGFNKGRSWRWQQLAYAVSEKRGIMLGAPASLYLDFSSRSVRLAVGVEDCEWYGVAAVRRWLQAIIKGMACGTFLQEAGPEFYTYRVGERVEVGARVVNLSRWRRPALGISFHEGVRRSPSSIILWGRGEGPAQFGLEPGASRTFTRTVAREAAETAIPVCAIAVSLTALDGGGKLDSLRSRFDLLGSRPAQRPGFVTVRDGDFWLDGKKWYPHGVNYMPSTGIGIEDGDYFEQWMGARAYDPEFIQRDLERIKDIGFNSVSIFIYHKSLGANNLLDFLRRCEKLGLYVNLSIRPGTPMDYRWEWWEEIIKKNRLWEQDIIYAYDIAWEPFFGSEEQRRRYDPQWRQWLMKKHGSLEAAEKAWGWSPRTKTRGTETPPTEMPSPTGKQLTRDGEHRKMIADYRKFADELIHERYLAAYKKIKAVDPNHLVSFRMTVTGDPTYNWDRRMPYDFKGVAKSMDFMAPEGYGRIGDWERVKPGMFTVTYARHCAPGKPVFWAEAGVSVWDRDAGRVTPERLAFQARYYRDFYKMMLASHSNGVAWWWYPGGFRVGENSDYGIINPDGTDRPVTKVIREFAKKMAAERAIPKPDAWIEIDRDADARGLFGIYEKVKGEYWKAVEAGKAVGLRER